MEYMEWADSAAARPSDELQLEFWKRRAYIGEWNYLRFSKGEGMLFSNRDLRKLIVPLVLEQALTITVGMADTMMVSSVGEAAISGVSLVDMINMLIISILAALATGGSVVTSQCLGAGKPARARASAKQLLLVAVAFTLLISACTALLHRPLLRFFFGRIEADVMACAVTYLLISVISFPFLSVYQSCAALFRSMGNSKVTFYVSLLMNVINIAGNAVCIFGLHMGVEGVAIPSLVSRMVAAAVLYGLLRNPRNVIYLERGLVRPDWATIHRILYIGIPSGIENGIFQLGRVLVVSIISGFGTVQIAANGVANNLDAMGCIIGQAMNLAMIAVIGRCAGAGDENQIRLYTGKLMKITYTCTIILNTLILVFLNPILSIYGLSPETTRLAWILVMIHNGCAMLLWPVAFVLSNMLRACNDVRFTMVVSIFSMFAFRIGFSLILGVHLGMGAIGVWIAMVMDWIFRSVLFVGRYVRGDWKKGYRIR